MYGGNFRFFICKTLPHGNSIFHILASNNVTVNILKSQHKLTAHTSMHTRRMNERTNEQDTNKETGKAREEDFRFWAHANKKDALKLF